MQRMETKIYNYEKYLQRKALTDQEAIKLLKMFETELPSGNKIRLTNVVEHNDRLRAELKDAMAEITRLENENLQISARLKKF